MSQRPLKARDAVAPVARKPDPAFAAHVRFRIAVPDDIETLVPLINDAYLREAWLVPGPRTTRKHLTSEMAKADRRVIVAEIDHALAGTTCLSIHEGQIYFGMLAVAKEFQGRGLASLLIAEAERVARALGYDTLRLDCAEELGLPPFYASLGYAVEQVDYDYYFAEGSRHEEDRGGGRKGPITRVVMKKEMSDA